MKNVHSDEFRQLWTESLLNRLPLSFTIIVRVVVAALFIFYIVNYLSRFKVAFMITIVVVALVAMVLSRSLKHRSIKLERLFIKNLRSREIAEEVSGERRPLFEGRLLDRDIHIGEFDVPEDSIWVGRTLKNLQFRNRFGVHVSSILRGSQRINIPNGSNIVFPGDRISVIGSDEQLKMFSKAMATELVPEDPEVEKREMKLRKLILSSDTPFIGKTLAESGIRDQYGCMVVGVEEGQENLTLIDPLRKFRKGDIIWLVGEEADIERVRQQVPVRAMLSASSDSSVNQLTKQ